MTHNHPGSPARLDRAGGLIAAALGMLGSLFFGALILFFDGKWGKLINRRTVSDGMFIAPLILAAGLYIYFRARTPVVAAPARRSFQWRWAILLAAILLGAAFLRFYHLGYQSLWRDELASVARVESATLAGALALGNWQDAWPTYHVPLYWFIRIAGDSEFAFRLPSALAGVLSAAVMFALGHRLFSGREGLLGALFAAVLPMSIQYGQEMRTYSFLILLAALSGYFWLRLMRALHDRRPVRYLLLAYTATSILLSHTHYFGLILVGVEGLGALAMSARMRRLPVQLAVAYGAVGAAFLPWVPLAVMGLTTDSFVAANKPPSLGAAAVSFAGFLFRSAWATPALVIWGIGIALALWWAFRAQSRPESPLLLAPAVVLSAWLVVPFALLYFRSISATPIMVYRYLLVSLPAVWLIMARIVTRIPIPKAGQAALGLAAAGLCVWQVVSAGYYVNPSKTQLRDVVQYVAAHDSQYPGSLIMGAYLGGKNELDYYFHKGGSDHTLDMKISPPKVKETIEAIEERSPHFIWFIGQTFYYDQKLLDYLDQTYVRRDHQEFFDVSVWLFESKDDPPASP